MKLPNNNFWESELIEVQTPRKNENYNVTYETITFNCDYAIGNDGSCLSYKKGEYSLKPIIGKHGYLSYGLCDNGNLKMIKVHRLVALHFCYNDDPINKTEIDHLDGNKLNNHYTNLEWVTGSENIKRFVFNKKASQKLEQEHIINIKNSTKSVKELSLLYNVTTQTVYNIKNNKTWKHLAIYN